MKKAIRLTLLATAMQFAALAMAAPPQSGLDLSGADKTARPQDDLFLAANGHWLSHTVIPNDKSSFGAFTVLADMTDKRVRSIAEELAAKKAKSGNDQKIGDYFKAFLDTAAIDKAGLAPLRPMLDSINAIQTREQLAAWMGKASGVVNTPVGLDIEADYAEPGTNRLQAGQAGLGLPDQIGRAHV